jgi:hypothetical protein
MPFLFIRLVSFFIVAWVEGSKTQEKRRKCPQLQPLCYIRVTQINTR